MVAASTRSIAPRSAVGKKRITNTVVDELRVILKRRDVAHVKALVADFATRHRLTHRDVDALLVALAQADSTGGSQTSVITPTPGDSTTAPRIADRPGTKTPAGGEGIEERNAPSFDSAKESDSDALANDDLAWMFGEEPEFPTPRAADDLVGEAFDDLLGDWTRTGGLLSRGEVALLATKRGLSPAQHAELLSLLEAAGVELSDSVRSGPRPATSQEHESQGDLVRQYLRDIGRYPLISARREVELWSLMSQGTAAQRELEADADGKLEPNVRRSLQLQVDAGQRAYAELVCANLRLVVSIAKARRYESSGVEFADRIQDGNLGLMRAAEKFDGSKGFKFSTYATYWIKQAIERGIGARGRAIRIPHHMHEQLRKVRKAVSRLTARLDREPTLAEICDATGLDPGKVQAALDLMRPIRSLDALLGDEGDLRLSDVLVAQGTPDGRTDPAAIVAHATLHEDVERTLKAVLPERAVHIVKRRFGLETGEEETLDEIGASYGVSRERIRQIQAKSLKQLRESPEAEKLRAHLVEGP